MSKSLIGWDFGTGRPVPLPEKGRDHFCLYRAQPVFPPFWTPFADQRQNLDIWRPDPRLSFAMTFRRQLRQGGPTDGTVAPKTNIVCSIEAWAIERSENPSEGIVEICQLATDDLFENGGAFDDVAEFAAAIPGIRFKFVANLLGVSDHDLVASLIVLPHVSLGCIDLAQMLIERLDVTIPAPLVFAGGDVG
jgi:hypothetical protein